MTTKYGVAAFQEGMPVNQALNTPCVLICEAGLYDANSPPTDVSDRIGASFPSLLVKELHKRLAPRIAELDKYVESKTSQVEIV